LEENEEEDEVENDVSPETQGKTPDPLVKKPIKKFRFKRVIASSEPHKDEKKDMPVEAGHRPNWRERALMGHISNAHPLNYLYPILFLLRIAAFVAIVVYIH